MLAMDWAEDKSPPELQQFDFVFLIALRDVDSNVPLEHVVLNQHGRFQAQKVPLIHINQILDGSTNCKVLLLFDGYDEYLKGTNLDIDNAITNTCGDCFLIVTTRPGDYMDKNDREQMDGEIQIKGLSGESIREYANIYLESEEKCVHLIERAHKAGIYELLRIPIFLLMVCVLYYTTEEIPSSRTKIIWKLILMCIDRSALKHLGRKSSEISNLDEMLYLLGNYLGRLSKGTPNSYSSKRYIYLSKLKVLCLQITKLKCQLLNCITLLFKKQIPHSKFQEDVEKVGSAILKFGLLHGVPGDNEVNLVEQSDWLTYPHKLFQDAFGGLFLSMQSYVSYVL